MIIINCLNLIPFIYLWKTADDDDDHDHDNDRNVRERVKYTFHSIETNSSNSNTTPSIFQYNDDFQFESNESSIQSTTS